jgi:hypothetical protein
VALRQGSVKMPPSHDAGVEARPRRALVRHVADDPGSAIFHDSQALHGRQNPVGQDNFAADVFAGVIRVAGSGAHIDERGFEIGAAAVVSQPYRIARPIPEQGVLRLNLPESRRLDRPPKMGTHETVVDLAVDGELFSMNVLQSIFLRPLQDEVRGLIELRGRRDAMQARQGAQIFIRRRAAGFVAQQRPLRLRQKRPLRRSRAGLHGQ